MKLALEGVVKNTADGRFQPTVRLLQNSRIVKIFEVIELFIVNIRKMGPTVSITQHDDANNLQ